MDVVAAVVVSYDYLPGAETLMAQKFTANIQSMNGFTNEYGGSSRTFNGQGNFFFSPPPHTHTRHTHTHTQAV